MAMPGTVVVITTITGCMSTTTVIIPPSSGEAVDGLRIAITFAPTRPIVVFWWPTTRAAEMTLICSITMMAIIAELSSWIARQCFRRGRCRSCGRRRVGWRMGCLGRMRWVAPVMVGRCTVYHRRRTRSCPTAPSTGCGCPRSSARVVGMHGWRSRRWPVTHVGWNAGQIGRG